MKGSIEIAKNKHIVEFGKYAPEYSQEAEIQKDVSGRLLQSFLPWKEWLPAGPILEIGAGTGFLSQLLCREFPGRSIHISDASWAMLNEVGKVVDSGHTSLRLFEYNPETDLLTQKYALIIHSFVAQWFSDPGFTMSQLSEQLLPNGMMVCALPAERSFSFWKKACDALGLPYTGNKMPVVEEMLVKISMAGVQVDFKEETITQTFKSALDFFRHLKKIGASSSLRQSSLNPADFKKLCSYIDSQCGEKKLEADWHVVYLAVKKDA